MIDRVQLNRQQQPRDREPREKNKLSSPSLRTKPPGLHGDGGGLWLQVARNGRGRSWIFRYRLNGQAHEMGLGSLDDVGLAEARDRAEENRKLLAAKPPIDPLEHRRALYAAKEAEDKAAKAAVETKTFRECAKQYVQTHRARWGNPKHAGQWVTTLETYVYPAIGDLPINAIDTDLVMKVLLPIWHTKTQTAKRVRGRIEEILDSAKVLKQREGENPARWRGHLKHLLPEPSKVAPVKHFPALPYERMGEFMADLRRKEESVGRLATEFTILTNLRTGSVRMARKSEIDLAKAIWTIPPRNLKSKRREKLKPLKVPLSAPALRIAERMIAAYTESDLLFPGEQPGQPMSDQTMLMLVKRMGYKESDEPDAKTVVTHGFRSTFKDWAHEKTHFPDTVIEMAMAHAIDDEVEAAYRRGDLCEKRCELMDAWANFCDTAPVQPQARGAEIIDLDEERRAAS